MWGRCLIVLICSLVCMRSIHIHVEGHWCVYGLLGPFLDVHMLLVSGQFGLVRKLNILVTRMLAGAVRFVMKLNILGCCLHCLRFIRSRRISQELVYTHVLVCESGLSVQPPTIGWGLSHAAGCNCVAFMVVFFFLVLVSCMFPHICILLHSFAT